MEEPLGLLGNRVLREEQIGCRWFNVDTIQLSYGTIWSDGGWNCNPIEVNNRY